MKLDPNNKVVQLCVEGISLEADGNKADVNKIYMKAWDAAENDFEKCVAAHYIARTQPTVTDKLHWDNTALEYALKANNEDLNDFFPSLYLNIGKCHEDLNDFDKAKENYQKALTYTKYLDDEGLGKMIKTGIMNGLARVNII